MKKQIGFSVLVGVLALTQGCATITRGTTQDFSVTSSPSSAHVKLSTGMTCETPCHLNLKRNQGFGGTISKKDFKPVEFSVQSKMKGQGGAALAGNLIIGGIIGVGVDAASGATLDLVPNNLHGTLVPTKSKRNSTINAVQPTQAEKTAKRSKEQGAFSPEMPGT